VFFVAGASGNVGSQVVRALADRGLPVRALSRRPPTHGWPAGVDPVSGDLGHPQGFADALRGVQSAFLLSGYPNEEQLLAHLRDGGARRVVLLSANSSVHGDLENVVSRYHVLSEQAVRSSGLPWTILRPVSFMSNTLQWVPQLRQGDVVTEPFSDVPVAVIDPADIGAVAATAMISDEHASATYRLTGPQALYPADRARILGSVLGRDVRLDPESDEAARVSLHERMTEPYVEAFFDFFRSGRYDEATIAPVVPEVTGRPARPFETWGRDNARAFTRDSPEPANS
jgi:uncharacterized protein YbjT (DUF2867 family)